MVPTVSVENLLLDAYRRVDEGERPRREKIPVEEELCVSCTIECSPEIKARYLKPDVCLWRNMPSVLKDPSLRGRRKKRERGPRRRSGRTTSPSSRRRGSEADAAHLRLRRAALPGVSGGLAPLRGTPAAVRRRRGARSRRDASGRGRGATPGPKKGPPSLGLLRKGAFTVALDSRGQQYSSEELSAFLAEKKLYGQSHFQFLLGGAPGLTPACSPRRDHAGLFRD